MSIADGLISSDHIENDHITVTKRHLAAIEHLTAHGVYVTQDNVEAVKRSDIVLIVVKPYNVRNVLDEIKSVLDPKKHLVVSLATGISIKEMQDYLDNEIKIFRAMPNIATDIRESITCICSNGAERRRQDNAAADVDGPGRT